MIDAVYLREGLVCTHHSGRVYTVLFITNKVDVPNEHFGKIEHVKALRKFPETVVYIGANGKKWSRPLTEFIQKFTTLYNGTSLVNNFAHQDKSTSNAYDY